MPSGSSSRSSSSKATGAKSRRGSFASSFARTAWNAGIVPHLLEPELARREEPLAQRVDLVERGHARFRIPELGLEAREVEPERGIGGALLEQVLDGADRGARPARLVLREGEGAERGEEEREEGLHRSHYAVDADA